jgi:signal recognition particle receptor subunit beta
MQVNRAKKTITLKLVYAGAPQSGKTASLEYIQAHAAQAREGAIESIRDSAQQTLLFDFAPFSCEKVGGYEVHFQIFTLPGGTEIETPRELGFNGMDGLVIVVDSRWLSVEQNVRYFEFLQESLAAAGIDLGSLPHVLQYNRRDEVDTAPIHYLDFLFNKHSAPSFEASSLAGVGIFETLNGLARLSLNQALRGAARKPGGLPDFARIW